MAKHVLTKQNRSTFTHSLLLSLTFASVSIFSTSASAQIEVDADGNVKIGNMSVSSEGDVNMEGLDVGSDGSVNMEGLNVDSLGSVNMEGLNVDSYGNVKMDGLDVKANGNVKLNNISVGANGMVIIPGIRVESNGSVSMGSEFDSDTLSDAIDDPGESANLSVLFESGSHKLTAVGRKQVEEIADAMMFLGKDARIEIQGHTDAVGKDKDNLKLSRARANTVVDELKDEHFIKVQLMTSGHGEALPIASNDHATGRQLNRRVTIVNISTN